MTLMFVETEINVWDMVNQVSYSLTTNSIPTKCKIVLRIRNILEISQLEKHNRIIHEKHPLFLVN